MFTFSAIILTFLTLNGVLSKLKAGSSLTKARPVYRNFVNGVSFAHFTAHKHHRLSPRPTNSFGGGVYSRAKRLGHCAVACVDNPSCFSFNFGLTRGADGSFECEVLDSDIYNDTSGVFLPNEKYHHYSIKSVCEQQPCENGGKCLALYEENHFRCLCPVNYEGDVCDKDIDECIQGTHNCSQYATCSNNHGSFDCTCLHGYSGDGVDCVLIDSDECLLNTHNCSSDATCSNFHGGFTCTCNNGYTGNGVTCSDVDECSSGEHSCHIMARCENTAGSFTCVCVSSLVGDGHWCGKPSGDCLALKFADSNKTASGIYTIKPDGARAVTVFCDMETDGGGWTVIQRRVDASVDFNKNWGDYKTGFGDLRGNFWLGNDNIHFITTSLRVSLRVDLRAFDGNKAQALYGEFSVGDETFKYVLKVSFYKGGVGDSFTRQNGMKFSTKDSDNDLYFQGSCSLRMSGAWWYSSCSSTNLNGLYYSRAQASSAVLGKISWAAFNGGNGCQFTEMKVRPRDYSPRA